MRRRKGTKPTASAHERLAFIEGLRGIAALYVVLTHFVSMIDPSHLDGKQSQAPEWLQKIFPFFWYGHIAVAAFIVLSGYCLQTSLFGGRDGRIHKYGKFYARRAKRILPPYYATLICSVLVSIYITQKQTTMPFTQYVPVTQENVLAHVFMIHNLSADWMYKLNGVLWSIAIEWQLYLLFPLLVWMLFKLGRFLYVALLSAAAVAALILLPDTIRYYVWYVPLFALGMAASHLAYRPNLRAGILPRLSAYTFVLAIAGLVYSCSVEANAKPGAMIPVTDTCIGVAIASLVYLGTVAPWTPFTKLFAWKPIASLGFFSYSLYLMHHPIEQILYVNRPVWANGYEMGCLYLMVVCLPIILLTCYLFSLLFELPFMATKKSRVPTQKELGSPVALPLVTNFEVAQTERAIRTEALVQATLASAEKVPNAPAPMPAAGA